ncbi:MAG TPA: nickel pincer cofactor biosynthesis protein LarB [Planctomycetota bacterium]|jgi:NCAIR mutase (PurE)-related protein|nr:nickel pincer cofactor biosynthesis protein LarB [Planctomycetota bacterium]
MTQDDLLALLTRVQRNEVSAMDALNKIRLPPVEDITCARVDHHRSIRCGFPEVIFCQGKRPEDITRIARTILKRADHLLATRADERAFRAVKKAHPKARYHDLARCVTVDKKRPLAVAGRVLVLCAGTADIPVAEEARVTAQALGHEVDMVYDAGVAGIHRLLANTQKIHEADCIVCVAGMEGALPSVVGGLADSPVIAVPTSVGYGASFGGLAPLLTMLNSCSAGVAVVNIDNGFGAGYLAALITRKRHGGQG